MNEAEKIELVWRTINATKDVLSLTYEGEEGRWTDKKMEEYYYKLNDIACELGDREVMSFQQEDK